MTPTPTPTTIGEKRYSPQELTAAITQTEALIGQDLDDLIKRFKLGARSATPPRRRHRLVELLLRLRDAAADPSNELLQSIAAVAIAEVGGILEIFEAWRGDPTWPEFQRAVCDPRSYLHAVTTLSSASALKEHHPRTELVASSESGRSPDIRMLATDDLALAIEVKTSDTLGLRSESMTSDEAMAFLESSLKNASSGFKRQLQRGKPGMLVVGGFHIDQVTFDALNRSVRLVVERGRPRPQLLAIMVSHTRFGLPNVRNRRIYVGLQHATQITTNPRYQGSLRFVGAWGGAWSFEAGDKPLLSSRAARP